MYLVVSSSAINLALIREELGAQHLAFYMSKALNDAEPHYPKIKKAHFSTCSLLRENYDPTKMGYKLRF